MVTFAGHLPFEVVTCNIFYAGRLHCIFPVQADKALMKDVLTCMPLAPSTYKSRHPNNTNNPDAVGGSSEDEAEGLEEIPGVSRHLQKPPHPEPTPEPTPTPTPVPAEEEGVIKVQKRDLKRVQGILKDILAGRKIRAGSGASCEDVPFQVPIVEAGDKDCSLCHQSFSSTKALRHHMKTHTGETGWVCEKCSKVLSTRAMLDLHVTSCGKPDKQHNCQACGRGYTTKQALVAHMKAKHGPPPTTKELTCPICEKVFKVLKTMCEHVATHKGSFPCPVEGCTDGPFSLPKWLNRHLAERHGFSAHKQ